jgi:cytochrome P450
MMDIDSIDFAIDELPGQELHDALAAFRRRGPVTRARFLGLPAWIITGHAALAEAFRDTRRFPPHLMYRIGIEGAVGRTFISMDEPDHQVFRRLATPAFRSRAVASYEREGLESLAHELVDRFVERSDASAEADLVEAFAARFPYLVITRLLGLPREREDEFHAWALALLRFRNDPESAAQAGRELTAFLAPVVEARRRDPRNDVISELAHAEVEGRALSDEEIYSHVRLLFPTGGETTHGTLGNLIYALLTQGDAWERVRDDPTRAQGAVEEVLRWESSIAVLPRMSCGDPVDFHGAEIAADSWVLFAIAGANRDPEVFAAPDRYDIERPCDRALTFGPGPKSCPGLHLARKNLTVAIQVLAERLPDLRLLDEQSAVPRRSVLRSPDVLRVRWR